MNEKACKNCKHLRRFADGGTGGWCEVWKIVIYDTSTTPLCDRDEFESIWD